MLLVSAVTGSAQDLSAPLPLDPAVKAGTLPNGLRYFIRQNGRPEKRVMLRLAVSGPQYERGLKALRTWDRRAKESNLLYPNVFLDNILLVKQVTETLNQCGTTVKLYRMDWGPYDYITNDNRPSLGPFLYFKELKRLNESLHIPDARFQEIMHPAARQASRGGQKIED